MAERPPRIGDAANAFRLGLEAVLKKDRTRAVEVLTPTLRLAPRGAHVARGVVQG